MDFIGFGSDIEEPSALSSASLQDSQDYWMGKKFFSYLVAKGALPDHRATNTMEHHDVSQLYLRKSLIGVNALCPMCRDIPCHGLTERFRRYQSCCSRWLELA